MRRLHLTTAGESHGPGLTVILRGVPAGLAIDLAALAHEMQRRQHGYGRGGRMKIESDAVEIRGGVRGGVTLGSPIALWTENRDFETWRGVMDPVSVDVEAVEARRLKAPRPGHADLAGGLKYHFTDLRDALERASARETAARVAAGAIARQLLGRLGVEIRSGVRSLGSVGAGVPVPTWEQLLQVDDGSPLRAVDPALEPPMVEAVQEARRAGDTLGGSVTVIAHGVPPGLGSYAHWDEKLDGRLAQAVMAVPAIKAVELGSAVSASRGLGSAAHDAIYFDVESGFRRSSNRAGGLEGGVTNGEDVVITAYMKPISTLRAGLPSVDLDTLEPRTSQYERSDVTALPAAGVVAEAMVALVLADAALEKYGGDSLAELEAHFAASRDLDRAWPRIVR
ncbi:MAG: chorismate synthase [Thermoanaerobaculia bacterium]